MKLAILGATGPTGQCLVQLALNDGHDVTAIVRNPNKFPETILKHERFRYVEGNIFSADSLRPCLDGAEVILSCLGYPGFKAPFTTMTFYTESCKAIVGAMKLLNSKSRLILMSSCCSKYEPGNPKFVEWVFKPIFIGRHLDDMYRMEQHLEKETDIDFVVVRPPGLINGPSTGKPILAEEDQQIVKNHTMGIFMSMSRADVAKFMLTCATDGKWSRKCVAIAV